MAIDPWDPNNWPLLAREREFHVYLDERLNRFALVDEIDYSWAIQWRWNVKTCRAAKEYARRAVSTYHEREPIDVKLRRKGARSIYLHIEIMRRTGIGPPSPLHIIVDHRNGDSLDCRRSNLRWATTVMNNRNRFGSHANDLVEMTYA